MTISKILVLLLSLFAGISSGGKNSNPQIRINHVSPGNEEFPRQVNSTTCGDFLIAQGGFIKYRHDSYYKNNERCVWTLRTPKWQVSFLIHSADFHSVKDYLAVYVLGNDGALIEKGRIDSTTGYKIIGAIGPTVFLTFVTDGSGNGQGFILEYFGFGYGETTGHNYQHHHLNLPSGQIAWPTKPVSFVQNTFATFTLTPTNQNDDVVSAFTVNMVDLIRLRRGCDFNSLSVHQLLEDGFVLRLKYCEPDLLTSAKISFSSPLLITYTATIGPLQRGISFSWKQCSQLS